MLGLGLGLPDIAVLRRRGVPGWVLLDAAGAPAALAIDREHDRGWFDGRSYPSVAALLAAAGGVASGDAIVFGPYRDPTALELLTNGEFTSDVSGWAGAAGGSISWAAGRLVMDCASGFCAFSQTLASMRGRAIELKVTGRRGTATGAIQAGVSTVNAALGGGLALSADTINTGSDKEVAVLAATPATVYAGGRRTMNTGSGTYTFERASAKEVVPFLGWNSRDGFAVVYDFVLPSPLPGADQYISCGHDDSTGSGSNRHNLILKPTGEVVAEIRVANTVYGTVSLGTLSAGQRYRAAIGPDPTGTTLRGSLDGAACFTASMSATLYPGAAVFRLGENANGANDFTGVLNSVQVVSGPQPAWWLEATAGLPFEPGVQVEGDSGAAGAYGYGLGFSLRAAGVRSMITALGGSTLDAARGRLVSTASLLGQYPLAIWDLSPNGWAGLPAAKATWEAILASRQHGRIVVVATTMVGPSGDGSVSADTLAMEEVRDWLIDLGVEVVDPVPISAGLATSPSSQDLLDISARVLLRSQLEDSVHPGQALHDAVAAEVKARLVSHGWIGA